MFKKLLIAGAIASTSLTSSALDYMPLVIQNGPGGLNHKYAMELVPEFSAILKSNIVIEFKPGGNGAVGASTLMENNKQPISLMVGQIVSDLPVDQLNDIVPVLNLGVAPVALVAKKDLNVTNLKDLVKLNRNITIGYASGGGQLRWIKEFAEKNKVDFTIVPYKTGTAALADVVGGHLDLAVSNVLAAAPIVNEGKADAIVMMSSHRSSMLPQVPTTKEQGMSWENESAGFPHLILWASPGITKEQVKQIQTEYVAWAKTEEARGIFKKVDLGVDYNTITRPEQLIKLIQRTPK